MRQIRLFTLLMGIWTAGIFWGFLFSELSQMYRLIGGAMQGILIMIIAGRLEKKLK